MGCGTQSHGPAIEYWCAANPFEVAFADSIAARWNADPQHRPVVVKPIPEGRSSEEVILAALVGHTEPDIYSNVWPGVIEAYRDAGVLFPLDSFPDFEPYISERLPTGVPARYRSPDGHWYQMPWKVNPVLLAYNVGLLKDTLGMQPPRTYSDFCRIGEALRRWRKRNPGPDIWLMDPNISPIWWQRFFDFKAFYSAASEGGNFIDERKRSRLTGQPAQEVFQFFREGYSRGWFPISTFQGDLFLQGRLVFHATGPWSAAYYTKYAPLGFQWDYAPLPVPDSSVMQGWTYGDPKNIVIFRRTPFPRDCWDFVKFMTSPTADSLFLTITRQLPLRRNLLTRPRFTSFFQNHPRLRPFAHTVPFTTSTAQSVNLQEIYDRLAKTWDEVVVYRVKPVAEGLIELDEQVQLLLEREQ